MAVDEQLVEKLERVVGEVEGVFGFYVHDLETGRKAEVRADEAFPAASVIKVPILLRALELVAAGKARLDQPLRLTAWHKTGGSGVLQYFHDGLEVTLEDACTAMVALSDNSTTNLVLDVTGIGGVNAMLDRLACPRTRLHRYLGKPEMPGFGGASGPSQAVPREIGTLLEKLVRREVLTPELCEVAMTMLRRQNHRALLPRLLPEETPVAHKTGSLNGVRHDVGIIWRPRADGAGGGSPEGATAQRDVMAIRRESFAPGHPIVVVAMSREVADLRWTVENEGEVTIARCAKVMFDHLHSSSSSSSSSSPPVMVSRT